MKKIVFLSVMGLDVNVSIIKRLRERYDIYYISLMANGKSCIGDVELHKNISEATEIPAYKLVSEFIDLSKTFVVRHAKGVSLDKLKIEFSVLKKVMSINPDCILTDTVQLYYLLSRVLYRKRVISIIHDPFPHSGEATFLRKIGDRLLVKLGARYILFNENQRERFIRFYKLNQCDVFNSFLSANEILPLLKPTGILEGNSKKLKVLFWGRISPYKGIYYLLEAVIKYINEYDENIDVIIAGRGNFDFDRSKYDVYPQIHIDNNYLDSPQLASYLKGCDIVVCPYTDATQSGVVMMAYSLRKPVLATNVGGLPEMLDFGNLGLLVSPRNIDELYKALVYIKENPNILTTFSKEIEKQYSKGASKSWEVSVKAFYKAIDTLK